VDRTGFSHVALACRDLEQSVSFYDTHLHMTIVHARTDEHSRESGDLYWAFLRDPDGHQVEVSVGGNSISGAVGAARQARAKGDKETPS
jgi:catechol 2,3-dioxygenase-like lactoylglutathione lyase family enzyme